MFGLLSHGALCLWVLALAQEFDSESPPWMQSPLRTDSELVHARLSGQDYYIPAASSDAPLDPGLDQRNVFLVALLPNLDGRTKDNCNEFMKVAVFGRRAAASGRHRRRQSLSCGKPLAGRTEEVRRCPWRVWRSAIAASTLVR
jgi:hypothetical protein